jgi:hypothetical protein
MSAFDAEAADLGFDPIRRGEVLTEYISYFSAELGESVWCMVYGV